MWLKQEGFISGPHLQALWSEPQYWSIQWLSLLGLWWLFSGTNSHSTSLSFSPLQSQSAKWLPKFSYSMMSCNNIQGKKERKGRKQGKAQEEFEL